LEGVYLNNCHKLVYSLLIKLIKFGKKMKNKI
jgi:hypothetical protein